MKFASLIAPLFALSFTGISMAQRMFTELKMNQKLSVGDWLVSENKKYALVLQKNGNLALYDFDGVYSDKIYWVSNRNYVPPIKEYIKIPDSELPTYELAMREDGYLCIYKDGVEHWKSILPYRPSWRYNYVFRIQERDASYSACVFGTKTGVADDSTAIWCLENKIFTELRTNQKMSVGDWLVYGSKALVLQEDGNLNLYDIDEIGSETRIFWSSMSGVRNIPRENLPKFELQMADREFCIYKDAEKHWCSSDSTTGRTTGIKLPPSESTPGIPLPPEPGQFSVLKVESYGVCIHRQSGNSKDPVWCAFFTGK